MKSLDRKLLEMPARERYSIWVFWMVLIAVLTSISGNSLPRIQIPHLDKVVHAVLYSGLGFWTAFAWRIERRTGGWKPWIAWLYCVLYGSADELHQAWIPQRSPEIADLIVDGVSSGVGVLLLWVWAGKKLKGSKDNGQ